MFSKKIVRTFLLLVIAGLSFACSRAMLEDQIGGILDGKLVLSMVVTPSRSTIEVGQDTQLHAIATLADQTTVDVTSEVTWTAVLPSISSVDTIDKGKALGISKGMGVVNAIYQGVSANALVNVTNSNLTSIEVSPMNETIADGVQQSFIATGIYADNTKADLTSQVTWASSNLAVATISNLLSSKGHGLGESAGSATIIASLGGVSGSTGLTVTGATAVSLSITPQAPTVAVNSTVPFIATAYYNDGTSADVTAMVTWSSTVTNVATVSNDPGSQGISSSLAPGQTMIKATLNALSSQTVMTVSGATLDTLAITPANSSGIIGIQHRFTLTGTYSDGSTQDLTSLANWSTSDILKLLISDLPGLKGYALAILNGTVTVTATYGGQIATTNFTVTPATLSSIAVLPGSVSLPLGVNQKLRAIATFSDATTKDITDEVVWTIDNPSLASVSNAVGTVGTVTSNLVGVTNVVATLGGVTGQSVLTTTNAVLNSISLSPLTPSKALGLSVNMTATGHFSDGSTSDITKQVTWSTSAPTILNASNAVGFEGKVFTLLQGSGTIFATKDSVSQSTLMTVNAKALVSLTVTPSAGTILSLGAKQFKAIGLYSDGTSADLTTSVTWSVSNALGSINLNGLFLGLNIGNTSVTATLGSVSKTNLLTLSL